VNEVSAQAVVYLVGQVAACRSLKPMIEGIGLRAETHPSAESFLRHYDVSQPGCLLLDLDLPGLRSIALLDRMAELPMPIPVLAMSADASLRLAVEVMKAGATDFIEKPVEPDLLLDHVRRAVRDDQRICQLRAARCEVVKRWTTLTLREQTVAGLVVSGYANKQIALALGITAKTVEVHRARAMQKMKAASLPDLVRKFVMAHEGRR
jgi:FixJ family two-component response regulator